MPTPKPNAVIPTRWENKTVERLKSRTSCQNGIDSQCKSDLNDVPNHTIDT